MFKTINDGTYPTKGSKYSAAVDLYSNEDVIIKDGETKIIPLGVCLDYTSFPIYVKNNMNKLYLQLEPRSSIRAKGLVGCTGIIDIDYTGEVKLILHNPSNNLEEYYSIKKGDKIAQILLKEHKTYLFDIETNEKRFGGFGSTGA